MELRFPARYPVISNRTLPAINRIRLRMFSFLSGYLQWFSGLRLWCDQDLVHHAEILMQQNVTVKQEGSSGCRIAKIHTQLHAVERSLAVPKGNLNGVTQVRICGRLPVHFKNAEMNLMDVERMCFKGAIFDGPILDGTDL